MSQEVTLLGETRDEGACDRLDGKLSDDRSERVDSAGATGWREDEGGRRFPTWRNGAWLRIARDETNPTDFRNVLPG